MIFTSHGGVPVTLVDLANDGYSACLLIQKLGQSPASIARKSPPF